MMKVQNRSDGPALDLVSLATAKNYLRVDSTDDDDLIEALIQTASDQIGDSANTAWKEREAYGYLESWQHARFPIGPVTAVTAVEYKGSGDTYTTLATSKYSVAINTYPAVIQFYNFPALEVEALERIRISFRYGHDNVTHLRPPQYAQAILNLVAHFYDYRNPVQTGGVVRQIPLHVESLISTFRYL